MRTSIVLILTLALAASVGLGAEELAKPPSEPVGSPKTKAKVEPADNSYCLVCHRNFENEFLTAKHAKAGVGCEKCHGLSEKHSSDEDGITPPDIMYPRAKINAACLKCHPTMVKSVSEKKQNVCLDCHGEHRLKNRTRQWDKETGKLISDDGVRMMQESKPASESAK